jgi:hypothetical protein
MLVPTILKYTTLYSITQRQERRHNLITKFYLKLKWGLLA